MKNYIGISCTGHDNAIAIINSKGEIVFAEATERFIQLKKAVNVAADDQYRISQLMSKYCEPGADIVISKIWSNNTQSKYQSENAIVSKKSETLDFSKDLEWFKRILIHASLYEKLLMPNITMAGISTERICFLQNRNFESKNYEHHLTHAAYASYISPFDNAVCCILDACGEGTSCDYYIYKNGELKVLEHTRSLKNEYATMSSLGMYYGITACDLCGFEIMSGEEWKIMGLAAYGKLNIDLFKLLNRHMYVDGLGLVIDDEGAGVYSEIMKYKKTDDQDYIEIADIAFTLQHYYEELVLTLLNNLYEILPSDNLIFSGGCALNSSLNGKIESRTKFKNIFIPCAPTDDGNAVGAAFLAFKEDNPNHEHPLAPSVNQSPYLGSEIEPESVRSILKNNALKYVYHMKNFSDIADITAEQLMNGGIVGWVQGRAEYGPRALGNRSILADPRDESMRDRVNAVIKFRESFRPLAPSIIHEYGNEYFHDYKYTRYMERTLLVRPEKKTDIPAVAHIDKSARVQSVKEQDNPRFYALLKAFHKKTNVPVLLNTSFNVMGKPIIHDITDALNVFSMTAMNVLVVDNIIFSKVAIPKCEIHKDKNPYMELEDAVA